MQLFFKLISSLSTGTVVKCPDPRHALVEFDDKEQVLTPTRLMIATSGAIARPQLRVRNSLPLSLSVLVSLFSCDLSLFLIVCQYLPLSLYLSLSLSLSCICRQRKMMMNLSYF